MTDYSGRYVGIVHGSGPNPKWLAACVNRLHRPLPLDPGRLPVVDPLPLLQELREKTAEWSIAALPAVLESDDSPVVHLVEDVDRMRNPYTIMSMFSDRLKYGFGAVFRQDGLLLRLQLFNDSRFDRSLRKPHGSSLWWTRQWLPSLASPFFPFEKTSDTPLRFTRVFDGMALNVEPV